MRVPGRPSAPLDGGCLPAPGRSAHPHGERRGPELPPGHPEPSKWNRGGCDGELRWMPTRRLSARSLPKARQKAGVAKGQAAAPGGSCQRETLARCGDCPVPAATRVRRLSRSLRRVLPCERGAAVPLVAGLNSQRAEQGEASRTGGSQVPSFKRCSPSKAGFKAVHAPSFLQARVL